MRKYFPNGEHRNISTGCGLSEFEKENMMYVYPDVVKEDRRAEADAGRQEQARC